jgi:type I restriction enzyme, S subunit
MSKSTTIKSQLKEGYKLTEIGIIPEGWSVKIIGEIADVRTGPFGSALHEKDYVIDGTPIITVEHLGEMGVKHTNLPMVSDEDKLRLKAYSLNQGDLVFSRVGSVDRNALIKQSESGWLFSSRLLRVRINSRNNDSQYLSYHFHSEAFKQRVRDVAVGQTMASLNTQILKGVKVVLPPSKAEQEAIAHALSDIDALIESLDRLLTKKRQIKKGAMQELLTGKRRLLGFDRVTGSKQTEIGMIPENWEVLNLSEIATFTNGKAHENEIKESGRYIVVNSKFISSEAKVKKYSDKCFCATSKKDILIVMSDVPNGKAIAKCFLVDKDNTYTVNQRICLLKITLADPKFIIYQLNRNPFYLKFDDGVKQTNLRRDEVLACPLAIPALEEQIEIATILSDMDAEVDSIEAKLTKTRQIKQGMMHELLTGRIRLI